MAAVSAATELKVIISVVQNSQDALAKILADIRGIVNTLQALDGQKLSAIAAQVNDFHTGIADASASVVKLSDSKITPVLTPPDTAPVDQVTTKLENDPVVIPTEVKDPNFNQGLGDPELAGSQPYLPTPIKDRTKEVEEAFARLGLRTREELKQMAAQAYDDYATILRSGKATAEGLEQAWLKYSNLVKKITLPSDAFKPTGQGGIEEFQSNLPNMIAGASLLDNTVRKLGVGLRFLAGGFLAIGAVRYIKGLADEAARVEVLGTILNRVAQTAGYTSEQINKVDRDVQKLGITAASSRQSLTRFLQAGLDIKYAGQLARVAQDLAVIAGVNSSETFERLIVNIQQLDTVGLRWMGIILDRTRAEQEYAREINKIPAALTRQERTQAFLNATMKEAAKLEGVYLDAMGNVSKQLGSLERITQTYRSALGDTLLPAYSAIVQQVILMFEQLTVLAQNQQENRDGAVALGKAVGDVAAKIRGAIIFIAEHANAILTIVKYYAMWKIAVFALTGGLAILRGLVGAYASITAAVKLAQAAQTAYSLGKIGLLTILKMFSAKSIEAAAATMELAIAQRAAAASAATMATGMVTATGATQGATAAVWGLQAALGSLLLLLAVPIVIQFVQRFKRDKEEAKKPFWEQVKNVSEDSRKSEWERLASFDGVWNSVVGEDTRRKEKLFQLFRQWSETNKELVAKIEATKGKEETTVFPWEKRESIRGVTSPVIEEFFNQRNEQFKQFDQADIVEQLTEQRLKVKQLKSEYDALGASAGENERKVRKAALDAAEAEEKRLTTVLESTAETEKLSDVTKDLLAQHEKVSNLTSEVSDAQRQFGMRSAEAAKVKEILTIESARLKVMQEQHYANLQKNSSLTEENRLAEINHTREVQRLKERQKLIEQAQDAREAAFGGKFVFDPITGAAGGSAFAQAAAEHEALVKEAQLVLLESGNLETAIVESGEPLRLNMERLVETIETFPDLTKLREMIAISKEFAKTPEQKKVLQEAPQLAALQVAAKAREFRQPLVNVAKENYEIESEKITQALEKQADLVRAANEREEMLDRDKYDRGLLSVDEFYAKRQERIKKGLESEAVLQETALARLEGQRNLKQTPQERAALENQIREARTALVKLMDTSAGSPYDLRQLEEILRLEGERTALQDRVRGMQLESAAQYGGVEAAIALINERLRLQLIQLKGIEGAERAIEAIRQNDTTKARIDDINRGFQTRLSMAQANIDADEALLAQRVSSGTISEAEALRETNALIQRRIDILQEQLEVQKQIRAIKLEQLTARIAEVEADLDRRGITDMQARFDLTADAVKGLRGEIDQLNVGIRSTETEMDRLATAMEVYGDRLRRVFTDSLAQAISQSLQGIRQAESQFKQLGKALLGNVSDAIGRNLAQKVTDIIVNVTSKEDKRDKLPNGEPNPNKGKPLPGTSIFDKVFEMLGLRSNKPDGSKERPYYVIPPESKFGSGIGNAVVPDIFRSIPNPFMSSGTTSDLFGLGKMVKDLFKPSTVTATSLPNLFMGFAGGGKVAGPGTATSDSIPAMLSDGEYVMPAEKTKKFLPMLEDMRSGKLDKVIKLAVGGYVDEMQSIAPAPIVPYRYANGGIVITDGGSSQVKPQSVQGNLTVQLHPDTMNLTMREWLEREAARQYGRR